MKSGMIYLYYKDGEVASSRMYRNISERNSAIEGWGKIYGQQFKNCYLQIAPNTNDAVRNNGTNMRYKKYDDDLSSIVSVKKQKSPWNKKGKYAKEESLPNSMSDLHAGRINSHIYINSK